MARPRRNTQQGQALPIIALGMVAFIGFLGLALDGGSAYMQQRTLQRAADMAALAAASSFYRSNVVSGYVLPASMPAAVLAARNAASAVVTKDGYASSVIVSDVLLDYQGNPLPAGQQTCVGAATCPAASALRGFNVTLSKTAPTNIMRALGNALVTIGAGARGMITQPGGGVHISPLLLTNWYDATHYVPRNTPYPVCAMNPNDGIQYATTPDCRPKTASAVVLVQALGFGGLPVLASPFTLAPTVPFYLLHDPPTLGSAGGFRSLYIATVPTVQNGENSTLLTCPPSSAGTPCATPQYYVELAAVNSSFVPQDDNVWNGMNARIDAAVGTVAVPNAWSKQDCSKPAGATSVPPLTADNPRLMRLPIAYPTVPVTISNVAAVRVSETLMFCVQYNTVRAYLPGTALSYAVTGYFVNVADGSGTTTATPGSYFGQDILIRLLS